MKLLLLLLFCLFNSVQSCRTVSESNVTLTGVCPNDTFTVPIGKQLDYECTANYTGPFLLYWNISGVTVDSFDSPLPIGISRISNSFPSFTLTIMAITTDTVLNIHCGLCNTSIAGISCLSDPRKFIGTESVQLITFGKN